MAVARPVVQTLCAALLIGLSVLMAQDAIAQGIGADSKRIGAIDLRSVQIGARDQLGVVDDAGTGVRVTEPDSALSRSQPFRDATRAVVRITYTRNDGRPSVCTGVAVDENFVLTAGHCACGDPLSYSVMRYASDLTSQVPVSLVAPPIRFLRDACRVPGQIVPGFDLALLKTQSGSFAEQWLIPITHMVHVYRDRPINRLTVMGYGWTDGAALPDIALAGHVEIGSHFCSRAPASCARFQEFILSDASLNGDGGPTDTCGGDSGGPVLYARPDLSSQNEQELLVVGITSRALPNGGNDNALGCGGGGIYTAIARNDVLAWLERSGVEVRQRTFTAPP
jgi:hypothetical protein